MTTRSSTIPWGTALFLEDHPATIEDLDAVKAYTSQAQWIPHPTIGIDAAWHFCPLTRD